MIRRCIGLSLEISNTLFTSALNNPFASLLERESVCVCQRETRIRGNTVVAGEGEFSATAQAGAVDGRDLGLAYNTYNTELNSVKLARLYTYLSSGVKY